MATPKQEKLIKLIVENLRNKDNTKTLGELIKEAGYSEAISKNPSQILNSKNVQEGISDLLNKLDFKRKAALRFITEKKLKKGSVRDNSYVFDILTKNFELLSGRVTERTDTEISLKNPEEAKKFLEGVLK